MTLLNHAQRLFVSGDLAGSKDLARRAFELAKREKDVAETGRARALLGQIAHDELRHGPAREAFEVAARELERALGSDHVETRQSRALLALVHEELQDSALARRALTAAEDGLEPPRAPLAIPQARLWITIAVAHVGLGRRREAGELLEKVVASLESGARSDTVETLATAYLQLAAALEDGANARRSARIVEAYERCIELRSRAFGERNSRVAAAKFALARRLLETADVESGFRLASEALATLRELGLESEPRVSTGYATLGVAELMRGNLGAGARHLEIACGIEEKTFGAAHPATASMILMLAQAYAASKNWGKVQGTCARSAPALRGALGHEDAFLLANELWAHALVALGRVGEAADRLRSCLSIAGRRGSGGACRRARLHAFLARLELLAGKRERALGSFEQARALAFDADCSGLAEIEAELALVRGGARIALRASA
jgi:tetratricopeptide (TPR) repeat protein